MAIKGVKISEVRIRLRELIDSGSFIDFWELIIQNDLPDASLQYKLKRLIDLCYVEIKLEVDHLINKQERLVYLLKYIRLSETLLENEIANKNNSVMHFTELITDFIDHLNILYTANKDLKQEDIVNVIDKTKSTATSNEPFKYFYYLLFEKGINEIRYNFLIDEYNGQADLIIDNINDIKVYSSHEDGDYISKAVKFIDVFEKKLEYAGLDLKKYIKINIDSFKNKTDRSSYLQIISIELKRLYVKSDKSVNLRYVEKVKAELTKVANFLIVEYEDYLGKSGTVLSSIIQNKYNQLKADKKRGAYALYFSGDDFDNFIEITFNFLKNKYISSHSRDLYENIFTGAIDLKELPKITWIPKHSSGPNKLLLIHFFSSLIQLKLLNEDKKSLKSKLPLLFCDINGNTIENLQQSYATYTLEYDKDPKMNDFLAGL
jgi:hypothetical protein